MYAFHALVPENTGWRKRNSHVNEDAQGRPGLLSTCTVDKTGNGVALSLPCGRDGMSLDLMHTPFRTPGLHGLVRTLLAC